MRFIERLSNVSGMKKGFTVGQTPALQHGSQRLALQVLHHQEGYALFSDVIEGTNIGVIQTRDCASLGLETSSIFGPGGQSGRNRLDRDSTFQSCIKRAV